MLKKLASILILGFVSTAISAQDWRTPNGIETIEEVRKNINSWKGKFVGFRGKVGKITEGYKGKPIFPLTMEKGSESDTVMVGSLFKGKFAEGDEVMVFGLMTNVRDDDEITKQLTKDKFLVLGVCAYDFTQKWGGGSEEERKYCDEWFFKRFPKTPL